MFAEQEYGIVYEDKSNGIYYDVDGHMHLISMEDVRRSLHRIHFLIKLLSQIDYRIIV